MKLFHKIIHIFTVSLIGILLVFCIFLATFQTEWGKNKAKNFIVKALGEEGIFVSIDKIEGNIPFQLNIEGLRIETTLGEEFSLPSLKMRIALLPLFRKEICISYLYAPKITILLYDHKENPPSIALEDFSFPFSFSIKKVKVPAITIIKKGGKENLTFSLDGSLKLKRRVKELLFYLSGDTERNTLIFSGYMNKAKDIAKIEIEASIASLRDFSLFYPLAFDAKTAFTLQLEGPLETWGSLYRNEPIAPIGPLKGEWILEASNFALKEFEFLNRKWNAGFRFSLFSDYSIDLERVELASDLLTLEGKALLNSFTSIENLDLAFNLKEIPLNQIKGALVGRVHYEEALASLNCLAEEIQLGNLTYLGFSVEAMATLKNEEWLGKISLSAENPEVPLEGKTDFILHPKEFLSLEELSINSTNARLTGNLEYLFSPPSFKGDLFTQVLELEQFQNLFPFIHLKGQMGAEIHLEKEKQTHTQAARILASLKNAEIGNCTLKELMLRGNLSDVLISPKGEIKIDGDKCSCGKLGIFSFTFNTYYSNKEWPYTFDLKGGEAHDLQMSSSGFLEKEESSYKIIVDTFGGFALKKAFATESPLTISWDKKAVSLNNLNLRVGEGSLNGSFSFTPQYINAEVKAEHLPLDFLTLSSPSFSLNGFSSFEGYVEATEENMEGSFTLFLEEAELSSFGRDQELFNKGTFKAEIHQNTLEIDTYLSKKEKENLEWKAVLPIQYTLSPFRLSINKEKELSSNLNIYGKLENIFDFIDLGTHRITGLINSHLTLSKTLEHPSLEGTLDIKEGSYENYFTRSFLKEIEGKIIASDNALQILTLKGKDRKEGELQAEGSVLLDLNQHFPYKLKAHLHNLKGINFDMISANFTGPLEVTGDIKHLNAFGDLKIEKASGEIPDSIPIQVPVLPITYLNKPHREKQEEEVNLAEKFPFNLDIKLHAEKSTPGKVLVRGRGLRSEWMGDVQINGSNDQITASGSLSLLRGEFVFVGKIFALSEGEITLIDKPKQAANLKLKGTLALPEITITVLLNGDVEAPVITFQSTPYLPTSSILSHILFNEDISAISPMQAVQLAQTIVTMSGKMGPDVLETIRKSLGVDRLNIVSAPDGSDEVSLQIGKYLTKGVMITLSQGTESSQVIVEVELKHGFILQAETQPDEEGKFSLKWNRNY